MTQEQQSISLGYSNRMLHPGVHVCQIFSDDDERQEFLLEYHLTGLQSGEQAMCFSEKVNDEILDEFFSDNGISYTQVRESGAFVLSETKEIYFQDGRFDPDRMLTLLSQVHEDSVSQDYPAVRVIGEIPSDIQTVPGGERLLEYESKVSLLLQERPVTSVCQYDARKFDGATMMNVLSVHPVMIVRGQLV